MTETRHAQTARAIAERLADEVLRRGAMRCSGAVLIFDKLTLTDVVEPFMADALTRVEDGSEIVTMPRDVLQQLAGDDARRLELLAAWDQENELRMAAEDRATAAEAALARVEDGEQASPPAERAREKMPMIDKHKAGLYRKFDVRRTDGSSEPGGKHEDCCYFVLDLTHDKHAIPALRAYAKACREEYPNLAADLDSLVEGNPLMPYRTNMPPGPRSGVDPPSPAPAPITRETADWFTRQSHQTKEAIKELPDWLRTDRPDAAERAPERDHVVSVVNRVQAYRDAELKYQQALGVKRGGSLETVRLFDDILEVIRAIVPA